MLYRTAQSCKTGDWWFSPLLYLQVILNNTEKRSVESSFMHLIDKNYHFQRRKDVFEKSDSLRFTGCGCACLAVSILSHFINSNSVFGDYLLRGHFYEVESSAPSNIKEPTF